MATSSTINPNPNEGVYKYTVVTSGRPTLDCVLHHNDLPVPAADYLRKNGQADARVKRQMAKLSAGGGTPSPKGKEAKPVGFKKPSTQPLDPTEMSNYSPRTTTFVNGRPAPLASVKQQPLTPTALNLSTPPSRASPESVRGGSDHSFDDQEDAASVDSAPGLRQVNLPSKASISSLVAPAHAADRQAPASRFPQDYPAASEENLDLYLEQFFPELQSLSDAELLRLMDPNPSAPALPARSSTLAILQEMLQTQGTYSSSPSALHQHHSAGSNPPSSNWSIASDDHHHSANWSDTPSHSWRSPGSSPPGPASWLSWQNAADPPSRSRKRQRSSPDSPDDFDWPTLTDQLPALSDDLPPSKRPFIHHTPQPKQEQDAGPHPHLFSALSTSSSHNPLEPRPNPFASVSKLTLMQPMQQQPQPQRYPLRGLDLQTYYSTQSVASQGPQHPLACGTHLGSSCESLAGLGCLPPPEPASVLEQALRDLRAKPEALAV